MSEKIVATESYKLVLMMYDLCDQAMLIEDCLDEIVNLIYKDDLLLLSPYNSLNKANERISLDEE